MTNRPAPLPPIAELRAVAEAARADSTGEWSARYEHPGQYGGGDEWHVDQNDPLSCVSCSLSDGDQRAAILARHIATFSPSTVLALLDRVEALERVAQAARAVARQDAPEPDDAEAWSAFDTQRVERMVALSFALSALDGDQ